MACPILHSLNFQVTTHNLPRCKRIFGEPISYIAILTLVKPCWKKHFSQPKKSRKAGHLEISSIYWNTFLSFWKPNRTGFPWTMLPEISRSLPHPARSSLQHQVVGNPAFPFFAVYTMQPQGAGPNSPEEPWKMAKFKGLETLALCLIGNSNIPDGACGDFDPQNGTV